MKKYLAVLGVVLCANCFADNLVEGLSGRYAISHIINETHNQTYVLMPIRPERGYMYGNHIMFEPSSSTFKSSYSAPCGTDCFPSSQGTYQMEGERHIRLHLTNVAQHGFCEENYDRAVQQDLGLFLIDVNQENGGITLTYSGQ